MSNLQVACIPADPLLQARLKDAVGKSGTVTPFPSVAAVLPEILRGNVRCTVVAVEGSAAAGAIDCLRALSDQVPTHAVLAWCDRRALSSRQILDIARTGVAELLLRDVDDTRFGLGPVLSAAMQRSHGKSIELRMGPHVPAAVRPVFRYMLENVHLPTDLHRIASAFAITRQTLRNRLLAHRMPRPRELVTWCRLLVAGSMLDERGHTLKTVAWQLSYENGPALSGALKRYTGHILSEMRPVGVSDSVEAAFLHVLEHPEVRMRGDRGDSEERGGDADGV